MKNKFTKQIHIIFSSTQDDTLDSIEKEYKVDLQNERSKKMNFANLHPRIYNTPIVGSIGSWTYSNGLIYTLSLFIILLLFTTIKYPYFSLPFTGEHSMKYSTYVEPALYMSQKNDLLWYQKKYAADPVSNPEGIFNKFSNLPLFEWGLVGTYKIIPFGTIEFKTRFLVHMIGICILIFSYIFFKKWLPKKLAILSVFLIAINPLISFSTYITVLDSLIILCMFISLTVLNDYFEHRKLYRLFWAGIVFGIGNSIKYPLLLWLAPISFSLMYYKKENNKILIRDYFLYNLLGIFMIITTKTTFGILIQDTKKAILFLMGWLLFYILFYILLRRTMSFIDKCIEIVSMKKLLQILFFLLVMISIFAAYKFLNIKQYTQEFLTDSSLVMNVKMYKYMLLHQFKNYMTRNVFWLGIFGFLVMFVTKNARFKNVIYSFIVGSLIYWVIASKAIFFHNYYTMIIMITFSLLAAFFLYYLIQSIKESRVKAIVALLFIIIIFPPVHYATIMKFRNYQNVNGIVQFIKNNTKENEFIIYEGWLSPLAIYTGRGFIQPAILVTSGFRKEIQELGFSAAMQKYHIKYLFTSNEKPFYKDFVPLFVETNIIEASGRTHNRNIYIHSLLGTNDPKLDMDLKYLDEMEQKYKIAEKFMLEANLGRYKFFKFIN
jgi:hypothetical protein